MADVGGPVAAGRPQLRTGPAGARQPGDDSQEPCNPSLWSLPQSPNVLRYRSLRVPVVAAILLMERSRSRDDLDQVEHAASEVEDRLRQPTRAGHLDDRPPCR